MSAPQGIPGSAALFLGTFLASTGYGATFLLTQHVTRFGGDEADAGAILFAAMLGTFAGVPLVGWQARRIGAARLAATGSFLLALGFALIAGMRDLGTLGLVGGFTLGAGWGAAFVAAPMSLSELVTPTERAWWFSRFAAFQMAGIGLGPVAGQALLGLGLPTTAIFALVSAACCLGALSLFIFDRRAPVPKRVPETTPWLRMGKQILTGPARGPIAMVSLGACAFSGVMTYQSSLVAGTSLSPGTFFATYAVTVVAARWMLAGPMGRVPASRSVPALLAIMICSLASLHAVSLGLPAQLLAAALFGFGYGLVYPLILAMAINDTPNVAHHGAVMTWFVLSYFVGIFGFPYAGGWIVATFGPAALVTVIVCAGVAEFGLGLTRRPRLSAGTAGREHAVSQTG